MINLLPFSVVEAQALKHKVTPRVIDREVEQRDIYTENILIENLGPTKTTVYPSVNAVMLDGGGDITEFVPPSMADNSITVTSWLEISRAGIELPGKSSTTIPLTIRIHPQAEPGVYHAFIGFGAGRNRDIAESQVANGLAPGVVITLAVAQNNIEALSLHNFYIKRFITSAGTNAVSYELQNPGKADVTPSGEIIISNNRGHEVGSIIINPEKQVLAPGESRVFTADVVASDLLGKYKAFLTVDYGSDQIATVFDTVYFYVIPWWQILLLFGFLLFVVILVLLVIHRKYGREEDDEHGAAYIPVFLHDGASKEHSTDINLKR